MRILGIDPGYAITGYSIIDYVGNKFKLISAIEPEIPIQKLSKERAIANTRAS